MRVTLLNEPLCVTSATAHHAFTSLAYWHNQYYLAYREAPSHGITPPGRLLIHGQHDPEALSARAWDIQELTYPEGDLRDPRLISTPDYLYLLCGCYLASPHLQHIHGLSVRSGDNQIWSCYSYTRDGVTWAPLRPYLRPNCWGWSAHIEGTMWSVMSYDVGVSEARNTLTLWEGMPQHGFVQTGIAYDGGNYMREQGRYIYPFSLPSEPVLYQPGRDMACLARTEHTMLQGVYQPDRGWRWWDTRLFLHPSAILKTPQGWLLAARELTPVYGAASWKRLDDAPGAAWRQETKEVLRYEASVTLWQVQGNHFTKVLTLPDAGEDCAYAGLCATETPGEYLLSYYSSHAAPSPCSDVYVARLRVED